MLLEQKNAYRAFHIGRLLAGSVLAVSLACAGSGADLPVLQRIEFTSDPVRTQVTIHLSHPVQFKTGFLGNPPRVYIDLDQASTDPGLSLPKLSATDPFIQKIRIARREHNTTRIVADLKLTAKYSVVSVNDPPRLLLTVSSTNGPVGAQQLHQVETSAGQSALPPPAALISQNPHPRTSKEISSPSMPAGLPQTLPIPNPPPATTNSASESAASAASSGAKTGKSATTDVASNNFRRAPAQGLLGAEIVQTGVVQWQGQPVPGAIVKISFAGRGVITTTDERGAYRIEGLELGKWTFRIEMFGFQTIERTVDVTAASSSMNWSLNLGPLSSSTISGQPTAKSVDAAEDDSTLFLNAGNGNALQQPALSGINASESFIINGSMRQGLQQPRPDLGRREARKTGIRGAIGVTLWDWRLDAQPYSITGQRVPKPEYNKQAINFSLAGPLGPHTWNWRPTFTVAYQRNRGQNPFYTVATVPSLLERSGDFSRSIGAGSVTIYDPLTGLPFANNQIPKNRISAVSAGLLSLFPLPNEPGTVQNYQSVSQTPNTNDAVSANLDFKISVKDSASFSQTYNRGSSQPLQVFGFRDSLSSSGDSSTLSWVHTISPQLLLSTYAVYQRNSFQTVPYFAYGTNTALQVGIQGTSQDPANYGPPNLSFTNFGSLSDSNFSSRRDVKGDLGVTLYQSIHSHSLEYGFTYDQDWVHVRTDQNGRGTYLFDGIATSRFDVSGNPVGGTGFDFADFLLGLPESASIQFGASDKAFSGHNYAGFISEDWAIKANLSLSLGLRYEYYAPYIEKQNQIANLDVGKNFANVAVVLPGAQGPYSGVQFPRSLINPDRNGWAPRFGFAWQPFEKRPFTVRGSYGIYYDGSVYEALAERLASQPPFANTGTLTSSTTVPLTIANGFVAAVQGSTEAISNTYAVARNYKDGSAQIWNFALSQDLPGGIHVEEGYLGTKGTHLDIQTLPNRASPGSPLTSEERRIIPYAGAFIFDSSEGNSILHAGQVRILRRLQKGMSANLFYTFAKMIDDVSSYGGGIAVVAQNNQNLRAERGLSSQDVRHALTASYVLISPFGREGSQIRPGFFGALTRGWILQGGFTYRSGLPLTARVLGNLADAAGTGSVGNARADATGLPITSPAGFFNPAAFSVPAPGTFGNSGRNTIPTPSALTINASFGRTFLFNDKLRMEFRTESNNILNAVSITGFGTTVNASDYGVATLVAPMRTLLLRARLTF